MQMCYWTKDNEVIFTFRTKQLNEKITTYFNQLYDFGKKNDAFLLLQTLQQHAGKV
jgi:hypothetical protein